MFPQDPIITYINLNMPLPRPGERALIVTTEGRTHMLRSASPSAAAPKSGTPIAVTISQPPLYQAQLLRGSAVLEPSRWRPINATSSWAYLRINHTQVSRKSPYVRFGSGCPPPKSCFGSQFSRHSSGAPVSSRGSSCDRSTRGDRASHRIIN